MAKKAYVWFHFNCIGQILKGGIAYQAKPALAEVYGVPLLNCHAHVSVPLVKIYMHLNIYKNKSVENDR